ncbi:MULTISPECIES: hypothetical protein [unclassified Iodidimonas]|uniref:hypothetical protein n=1 Tax=unclassified Iodidimonas TaxID=2626145 RepID=UPI0024826997|nr:MULTISPECIES: hypothetical protein [unclassified Iodidimonas]
MTHQVPMIIRHDQGETGHTPDHPQPLPDLIKLSSKNLKYEHELSIMAVLLP